MKLKYELSKLAQHDLEHIWLYTVNTWSIKQANEYYEMIFKEIDYLCQNPNIGKSIHMVKENHRMKHAQSHLILYKIEHNKIWVDRILHKHMDFETKVNE